MKNKTLFILLIALFTIILPISVYATSTKTFVYNAPGLVAGLNGESDIYATAQHFANTTLAGTTIPVGQGREGGPIYYEIYRAFLYFNTSDLPVNATVISAMLQIEVGAIGTNDQFLFVDIWSSLVNPAVTTDQYFSIGSIITSVPWANIIATGGGNNMTIAISSDSINLAGNTTFVLRTYGDQMSIAPWSTDFHGFYIGVSPSSIAPVLKVTYIINSTSIATGISILDFPAHLATALGISVFTAGLFCGFFLELCMVLPVLIFTDNTLVILIFAVVGLCIGVALTWLPYVCLILIILIIALLYAGKVRDLITGGSESTK